MVDGGTTFLKDVLQSIAERSRSIFSRSEDYSSEAAPSPEVLSTALLSTQGEASGVALANEIVDRWNQMGTAERLDWFLMLANRFGPNTDNIEEALNNWRDSPSPVTLCRIHSASEPTRQELLRRINLAPEGTATLVKMREQLLNALGKNPDLVAVDDDFTHLLRSWFNRGFLELRVIDWSSPAEILDKIIQYDGVHEIVDWDELRRRLHPKDRRCFAFFHPQMPNVPLVFVEVALTRGIPAHIGALLTEDRNPIDTGKADTAVFYSISNTQVGLKGVSFGNFLIKQVVEELVRELPNLSTFVTLSPVPGFARWMSKQESLMSGSNSSALDPAVFETLKVSDWQEDEEQQATIRPAMEKAVAIYLLEAKGRDNAPADPVARFHLNNGAMLERINFCGDISAKGMLQAYGFMVNYLYDLNAIERNHELYANGGKIAASPGINKLLDR